MDNELKQEILKAEQERLDRFGMEAMARFHVKTGCLPNIILIPADQMTDVKFVCQQMRVVHAAVPNIFVGRCEEVKTKSNV